MFIKFQTNTDKEIVINMNRVSRIETSQQSGAEYAAIFLADEDFPIYVKDDIDFIYGYLNGDKK